MAIAVEHRLAGWRLVWRRLTVAAAAETEREFPGLVAEVRKRWGGVEALAANEVVAGVRRLFREAGTDPTRYRPSSEALLRRVLKGEELPQIHPLVDLNNFVSMLLAVPSCVMAEGRVGERVVLRAGCAGERMESLRGDFDLAGKPLLEDEAGPFGTPITDSRRVKVGSEDRKAWMVVYLPAGLVGAAQVDALLGEGFGPRIAVVSDGFESSG